MSPFFTVCPSVTKTLMTEPGSGDVTLKPAAGAAAGLGASALGAALGAAGAAAGAADELSRQVKNRSHRLLCQPVAFSLLLQMKDFVIANQRARWCGNPHPPAAD